MDYSKLYIPKGDKVSGSYSARPRVVHHRAPTGASVVGQLNHLKREYKELNYAAAEPSKFRRTRHSLGGTADAHFYSEEAFWRIREHARDMDRNDAIVGTMFDRAVVNILGCGMRLDALTGDTKLDEELELRWEDWANDKKQCDVAWKHTFHQMAELGLRHQFVDGDIFYIPRGTALQRYEGDRVNSPPRIDDDIVHGVEVDPETDRVIRYYFTTQRPGTRKIHLRRVPLQVEGEELQLVDAFDVLGDPLVYHVFDPKRFTQSRGITVLSPVFDMVGMFEDTNFARLVQQQVVSCIAAFITRERDYQWGNRTEETQEDGTTATFEELSPGMVQRLKPGETLTSFNPNVPNPEFFHHISLLVRLIGGPLGMPLELTLMDTTNTTFHGYRGVLQQAYKGFLRQQRELPLKLHTPHYKRLLKAWLPSLGSAASKNKNLGRHRFLGEGWPYVDPKVDAEADKIRSKNLLTSPRRLHAERGAEFKTIAQETVADMSDAIDQAMTKATELNEKHKESGQKVMWRELLNLDFPTGQTHQEKVQSDQQLDADGMPMDPPEPVKAPGAPAPKKVTK